MNPSFSDYDIPLTGWKKGMHQTESIQGSDYPFRGPDHVSFAKNHVSFGSDPVIFMQIYDGGTWKDYHAYLGLLERPIRPPDGLQDVSEVMDPENGGISDSKVDTTKPGHIVGCTCKREFQEKPEEFL